MSTAAQIRANQANSQHATGAKTEAGKAASSVNNRQHGFSGAFVLLPEEDEAAFRELCTDLANEHKPTTPTEAILVHKMAQHYWVSQRAHRLEEYCFHPDNSDPNFAKSLSLFLRYQTTHERAFHKCLDQLLKLRAERRKERLDEAAFSQRAEDSMDEAALSQRAEDSRIGFESQKLKQAAQQANELRKQEAHQAKTRLQNAKAEWQELNTEIKGRIEALLPGHTAISFEDLKGVLTTSIQTAITEKERVAAQQAA